MGENQVIVLNFSHPLTLEGARELAKLKGVSLESLVQINVPVQIDNAQPLDPQIDAIIADAKQRVKEATGSDDIHPDHAVIVPPGLSIVAVALGMYFSGYEWARIVPVPGSTPPRFVPYELLTY